MKKYKYDGVMCEVDECIRPASAKGMCAKHYRNLYYRKMREAMTPEERKAHDSKRYKRHRERLEANPKFKKKHLEYHRKQARMYYQKKCNEDPEWNARRQREFRKKNPEGFNMAMARFYFKRLSLQGKVKLLDEVEKEMRK